MFACRYDCSTLMRFLYVRGVVVMPVRRLRNFVRTTFDEAWFALILWSLLIAIYLNIVTLLFFFFMEVAG